MFQFLPSIIAFPEVTKLNAAAEHSNPGTMFWIYGVYIYGYHMNSVKQTVSKHIAEFYDSLLSACTVYSKKISLYCEYPNFERNICSTEFSQVINKLLPVNLIQCDKMINFPSAYSTSHHKILGTELCKYAQILFISKSKNNLESEFSFNLSWQSTFHTFFYHAPILIW